MKTTIACLLLTFSVRPFTYHAPFVFRAGITQCDDIARFKDMLAGQPQNPDSFLYPRTIVTVQPKQTLRIEQ